MWRELSGTFQYQAGASGTVSLPAGAFVAYIWCRSTAGGTVTIFGGDAIPIIANAAPFVFDPKTDLFQAGRGGGSKDVVFTSTDSYFIVFVGSGNT